MWRKPVGLGAKRTRTFMSLNFCLPIWFHKAAQRRRPPEVKSKSAWRKSKKGTTHGHQTNRLTLPIESGLRGEGAHFGRAGKSSRAWTCPPPDRLKPGLRTCEAFRLRRVSQGMKYS